MKKIFTTLAAGLLFTVGFGQITLDQNVDSSYIDGTSGVACTDQVTTGLNNFSRAFNLSEFGITGDFTVTSVTYGFGTLTGPIDVDLIIGSSGFYPFEFTELGRETDTGVSDEAVIIDYEFANPIVVPAGTEELVFQWEADGDGVGVLYFPGANDLGETGPSYIAAEECGMTQPESYASIGFPDSNLTMTVTGMEGDTAATVELGSRAFSVYPNPATDVVNIKLNDNKTVSGVEIVNLAGQSVMRAGNVETLNVNSLAPGAYVMKIIDNNGVSHLTKFLKK